MIAVPSTSFEAGQLLLRHLREHNQWVFEKYGTESYEGIVGDWQSACWYWEVREEEIVKTIAHSDNLVMGFTVKSGTPLDEITELIQFGIRLAGRHGKPYALCYPRRSRLFCRLAGAEVVGQEERHGITFDRLELKQAAKG